eukprot:jgi/Mesvir1/16373/Mv18120-RA.1
MLESDEQQAAKNRKLDQKEQEEPQDGFLSLTRPSLLNDISVDLSAELARPSKATLAAEEIRRRNAELEAKEARRRRPIRYAPTRGELREQEKKRAFFTGPYSRKDPGKASYRDITEEEEQLLQKRREDLQRYEKLKGELFLITLAVGATFTGAMNVAYGADSSISAGVGVLGSLMYLRLLSRAVDSLGASGLGGGPPRILVPVILILGFTKWNQSFADDYNVHLQLFPMLGAFFSYKLATIIQGATSFFSSNEGSANKE